jgi:hypothetical protein
VRQRRQGGEVGNDKGARWRRGGETTQGMGNNGAEPVGCAPFVFHFIYFMQTSHTPKEGYAPWGIY